MCIRDSVYTHQILQFSSKNNIYILELKILQFLNLQANIITPMHFIFKILELYPRYFLSLKDGKFTKFKNTLFELNLIVCTDYFINEFTPISIALTLLSLVIKSIKFDWSIPEIIFQLSGLNENQLNLCKKRIISLLSLIHI